MIKAVVFDMDGVLIDAKEWHYEALNKALRSVGMEISRADHLTTFDGLPTKRKLEMLGATHNLPVQLHSFINELKQLFTMEMVNSMCKPKFIHEYALSELKRRGYKLAVASNSVRNSVVTMMERACLNQYLEFMLSNEDVEKAKPHPDIYFKAMSKLGVLPTETLIVEDNDHGIRAATAAGAHVMAVKDVDDVNIMNILGFIEKIEPQEAAA